ncbi:hypothetical protein P9112_001914 [Eukaryota sp. TZLM1-RC]
MSDLAIPPLSTTFSLERIDTPSVVLRSSLSFNDLESPRSADLLRKVTPLVSRFIFLYLFLPSALFDASVLLYLLFSCPLSSAFILHLLSFLIVYIICLVFIHRAIPRSVSHPEASLIDPSSISKFVLALSDKLLLSFSVIRLAGTLLTRSMCSSFLLVLYYYFALVFCVFLFCHSFTLPIKKFIRFGLSAVGLVFILFTLHQSTSLNNSLVSLEFHDKSIYHSFQFNKGTYSRLPNHDDLIIEDNESFVCKNDVLYRNVNGSCLEETVECRTFFLMTLIPSDATKVSSDQVGMSECIIYERDALSWCLSTSSFVVSRRGFVLRYCNDGICREFNNHTRMKRSDSEIVPPCYLNK